MADIKRCPICNGKPGIRSKSFGFTWQHWCEKDGEKVLVKCVEPLESWGAAVKSWNEAVKEMKKECAEK